VLKGKITYLQRTISPILSSQFVYQFECLKRSIFSHIIGDAVDDISWTQARLSLDHAGFGLGFTEFVTDPAYIASCSASIDQIRDTFPTQYETDLNTAQIVEKDSEDNWERIFPNINCWMSRFLRTISIFKGNCDDSLDNSDVNLVALLEGEHNAEKTQKNINKTSRIYTKQTI
jgi:hypothetical protein